MKVLNPKFSIPNSEKGVSLIITFFVLVIILAVVLSISIIIYSEVKIVRNIGDSVVAFYAADSGIEETLYYDRKIVPPGATGSKRGICNICNSCPDCNCVSLPSGSDCVVTSCENCTVTFNTSLSSLPQKSFAITATVTQILSQTNPPAQFSKLNIDSIGSYSSVIGANATKRAIELTTTKDEKGSEGPVIQNANAIPVSQQYGLSVTISANITARHGLKSEVAHIYNSQNVDQCPSSGCPLAYTTTPGVCFTDSNCYSATWTGPIGVYSVTIIACDQKNNCSSVTIKK